MPEVLEPTTARQDFDAAMDIFGESIIKEGAGEEEALSGDDLKAKGEEDLPVGKKGKAAMDIFGESIIEEGAGEEEALSGDDLKAKGEEDLSVGKKEKPVEPEEEIDEYSHLKEKKAEPKKEEVKVETKPAEPVSEVPAELLDRAKKAGIPLSVMRKFDDVEEAEFFVLRAEAAQIPKPAAAAEEPKPVSKPADGGEVPAESVFQPFDLTAHLEEGETIDMYDKSIVKMVEHFNKQMEVVFNRTGKAVEPEGFKEVVEFIKQEQSRKGEEFIDTHLLKLADYKSVFGEGKWSSLSPNSTESKNRQAVVDEITDRIQIYKMNNRAIPSLDELVDRSVKALFPDVQVKAVKKDMLNSIEKRKAQSLSRVQDTAVDTDSKKRLAELDEALAQLQESLT